MSYIKIYNGVVSRDFRRRRTSTLIYSARPRERGRRRRRRCHSLRVSCSVAIRSHRPTSEPAAGTTYIRVYYIEMWRHFLREGGRNNLIIVSHRCGGGGSDDSPLWIEPNGSAHRFSSSLRPPSLPHLALILLSPSLSLPLYATRKPLSSALCAASRICLESLDTDYLWLEKLRGEEYATSSKSGIEGQKPMSRRAKNARLTSVGWGNVQGGTQRAEPQMASCEFVAQFVLCIRTTGVPPLTSIFSHFLSLLYRKLFFYFYFVRTETSFSKCLITSTVLRFGERRALSKYVTHYTRYIWLSLCTKVAFCIRKRLYLRVFI